MSDFREISMCDRPIEGVLTPPGSKSLTNRALICAALASGRSQLLAALDSEDTQVMRESLTRLGLVSDYDAHSKTISINSGVGLADLSKCSKLSDQSENVQELFAGNSGTTIRFLLCALAVGNGRYRLDGVDRMRERPLGDLLAALRAAGVDISSERGNDCAPVCLNATGLTGGTIHVRGDVSSQFLSGLLLAAPYARGRPLTIEVDGELVSRPYVAMTLAVMGDFGAKIETDAAMRRFIVSNRPEHRYRARTYRIEPDASAASYGFAAAAITGGLVEIPALSSQSLQGDVRFCDALEQMGCQVDWRADRIRLCGPGWSSSSLWQNEPYKQNDPCEPRLHGVTIDMRDISDTAQTLAVVAIFADSPTQITGVRNMRYKETDRIAAVTTELRRLGVVVEEFDDGLRIEPLQPRRTPYGWKYATPTAQPVTIKTYRDHRMAMSFALAGLRIPGVRIADPGCVAKTWPTFFDDFDRLMRGANGN
ncbi:MAG: 3-phosphoshikimate 1-carboxyvinyltransferase [Thermoguttaceae bacterium]|nr:3-phosphoshikimate 1-carboxyvinyltransferase [Thermoguttaceae bacterium]